MTTARSDTPALFVRDAVVDEKDGFARVSVLLGGPHWAGVELDGDGRLRRRPTAPRVPAPTTPPPRARSPSRLGRRRRRCSCRSSTTLWRALGELRAHLERREQREHRDASGVVVIGASEQTALSQPSIFAPPDVIVGEVDGFVDLVVRLSTPGLNPVTVATTPWTAPRPELDLQQHRLRLHRRRRHAHLRPRRDDQGRARRSPRLRRYRALPVLHVRAEHADERDHRAGECAGGARR